MRRSRKQAYDVDLELDQESEGSVDIFRQQRFAESRHPVEPLLRGEWR